MHKPVKLKNIVANPFRNMERYPVDEAKVETIRASIGRTGFWENIVGREVNGHVELAYGHHRWIALQQAFSKDASVSINIMKLNDDDMMRMMADENSEEFGASALVDVETVRALIKAFADGRIKLPKVPKKTPKTQIRYAPGFVMDVCGVTDTPHPYTAYSIAEFLGWRQPNGEPSRRIKNALDALEAEEKNLIDESVLEGLTSDQAQVVASGAAAINRTYEMAAKIHKNEDAKKEQIRRGRERAKKAAEVASKRLRDHKCGLVDARANMRESNHDTKELPRISEFITKLSTKLYGVLGANDKLAEKLCAVLKCRDSIEDHDKKELASNLRIISDRCLAFIDQIEGRPEITKGTPCRSKIRLPTS